MVNMTTAIDTVHADLMSLFNNCLRRHRRNALADIFESLSEDERVALLDRLHPTNATGDCEANGELPFVCNATDHSILCGPDDHRDIDILNDIQENSEENDRLSGLSEGESCASLNNLETARPSCLVGLKPASSTPSSSSSFTSTSSMSPSQQTPSSNSNCSSASSSPSSSSSEDEGTTPSCSSESSTFNTHGCTTSTTSPARSSSSSSSMIRCNISFSRVRRNALHDLLETLTQDDIEKLKNLYQSTLYSLKPFSEQAQSPIRGFHECKA